MNPLTDTPEYEPDDSLKQLDTLIRQGKCNPKLLKFLATKALVHITTNAGERVHVPDKGLDWSRLERFDIATYEDLYAWFSDWITEQTERDLRLARQARQIELPKARF
jgi:hypothetical protein